MGKFSKYKESNENEWEYKTITAGVLEFPDETDQRLNRLADMGWEVVSSSDHAGLTKIILRRKKK